MRIMSVLAATGAGAAVGWVCGLVPVWPVVRLMAAAVMGSFIGAMSGIVLALLMLNRSGSGGLGAVSFGLSEAVLFGFPVLVLIAVVSSFAVRRLGWSPEGMATYGPAVYGAGAALIVALWIARGMSISGGN